MLSIQTWWKEDLAHAMQDEGVVLSVVTGADGRTFLLVLDATSMAELARYTDLHCKLPSLLIKHVCLAW